MPFVFQIFILLFSVVIHEVSHGYAALFLGDRTAQYAGRLTLNPLKHIDVFGSLILPTISYMLGGIIFGWAKPVPYNPYNLTNQRWGPAIVGAAGPCANLLLAAVFALTVRFLPELTGRVSSEFLLNFASIASSIALLNLVLAVFNLVPIPPLDGSKVLVAVLPWRWQWVGVFLERYSLFVFLIFILFFAQALFPVALFLFRAIAGTSPVIRFF